MRQFGSLAVWHTFRYIYSAYQATNNKKYNKI